VRRLWHRRFLLRPDVDDWQIWQVHGYAHVDGVSGRVDLDLRRPVA
jgi:GH25 family lysozyme M1 (1,4-beta-N-acetylmuramidase)